VAQAQALTNVLNATAKLPQFSYTKARAAARSDANVDWARTKEHNADFNVEVDGCESFVMKDGSVCVWLPAQQRFAARASL
jgi:hypothetical protein